MSPDSTEVVAVVVTGVATEVVIAEVEVISRTVLVEGGAVGDFKLQPPLLQKYCHTQETLLLCIYAIPCTCHRIRLYITEQLINLNKA